MPNEDTIFGLELAIDWLGQRYIETAFNNWYQGLAGFNPGQDAIFWFYIEPVLSEWAEFTFYEFPWVDVTDYIDACYLAYDIDVMWRAFSDTIEMPVFDMEDVLYKAQWLAILLEIISFGFF